VAKRRKKTDEDERSAAGKLFDTAIRPIEAVQGVRERVNGFLLPIAWWVGWLGLSSLVVCAALNVIDEDHWPAGLDEDDLPRVAMASLIAASLVGWGCMQLGMRRVRELVGWRVGGWLFVFVPLVCALLVLAHVRGWTDLTTWPGGEWLTPFARFYTPALVAVGLASYATLRLKEDEEDARRRLERGVGLLVIFAPYALLVLHIALRVDVPWLGEPLEETLEAWGTAALVLQVMLAYFVSSGAAA
jgi:hypothetical protein